MDLRFSLLLPGKGGPKKSRKSRLVGWFEKRDVKAELVVYTAEFTVDAGFGEPGAIVVANRHHREFFLESVVVEGSALPCGTVYFDCNSWVQTTGELPGNSKSIFYSYKAGLLFYFRFMETCTCEKLLALQVMVLTLCPTAGHVAIRFNILYYDSNNVTFVVL